MEKSLSFPWLRHYPASVPPEITLAPDETLISFLEENFRKYKDLPMLENMGKILTYGEVDILTQRFAACLQTYTGLQPGDNVAVQLLNLLQTPIAMLGTLRAGMHVINISPLYTAYELEQQLNDANVRGLICLANFADIPASIIKKTPSVHTIIITEVGDLLGRFKGTITNFVAKYIKGLVPLYKFPEADVRHFTFKEILSLGKNSVFEPAKPSQEDIAFIQYTGGTTGVSKGVVLKHKHMLANIKQMLTFLQTRLEEGKEIFVTPIPPYHIFGLMNLWVVIQIGAKSVLITDPKNIKGMIKELQKQPFTCITGVNTLFNALLSDPQFASIDFSHVKMSLAGGVALQDVIAERWEKLTGNPLIEAYGLTEASPCIAANIPNGTHRRGTIGIPLPSTQVKIVDDNNQPVAPGEPGQLLAKGPQVMDNYWNKEEETEKTFVDGWLQTGDIASISPDGFIKILDRKKEMINVSGFNVYPNEIENVILTNHKVLEAAAVATWEEDGREVVKVYAVKKDPSLTEKELIKYTKTWLTNYKRPKYVEFRDTLPKSNIGKILRRVLQEEEKKASSSKEARI